MSTFIDKFHQRHVQLFFSMLKGKTIRLNEEEWVEVEEEATRLGISVTVFLKLLVKQYFNGIKFGRQQGEKGS